MAADTATYAYDNLNRLVSIVFTNGTTYLFVYDAVGNRTQTVTTCPSGTC